MTKKNQKNSRKTKKKQTWASDQTFSEKFWFFGFLEVFWFLVFSRFRGTSQLFDDSLGEKPWGKPKTKKPRENQKTKKPKLFRECLVSGSCLFFLFSSSFFCFFLVMTLKKLKKLKVFFWFFEGTLTWSKPKNQKNSGLFWFFGQIFRRHVKTIHAKNQKKPWVFFSFFKVMTKKKQKNSRKTKKKPNMSLRPNILWKVLVFWFFGFLEVFWFLVFSRFSQQGAQNLRSRNVRSVFDIGVAIMFFLVAIYRKKTHSITGLWYPLFPYANAFPQNMSGNLF